jgi:hypothetical protein
MNQSSNTVSELRRIVIVCGLVLVSERPRPPVHQLLLCFAGRCVNASYCKPEQLVDSSLTSFLFLFSIESPPAANLIHEGHSLLISQSAL